MQSSEDEVAGSDRSGCTNKLESQVAGIEDAVLVDVDIDSLIGAQVNDRNAAVDVADIHEEVSGGRCRDFERRGVNRS